MTDLEKRDWTLCRDPRAGASAQAEARERLLERYLPLVGVVVSRMALCRGGAVADRDDLMQSGAIGLMNAVERFEPARGVQFPTYASLRIRGSVLDSLRALDWVPRSLRRQASEMGSDAGLLRRCDLDSDAVVDLAAFPGEELEAMETSREVKNALARLPKREKRVLVGTYLEGRTLMELARELSVTESRACQIRSKALERLRHLVEC